jgi:hypothetical protein
VNSTNFIGSLFPSESSLQVALEFTPQFIGKTTGSIGFEVQYSEHNPAFTDTVVASMEGEGFSGNAVISLPELSLKTGERVNIPLKIAVQSQLTAEFSAPFRAVIRMRKSVLQPVDEITQGVNPCIFQDRDCLVEIEGTWNSRDSILTIIPCVVMLGDTARDELVIDSFEWTSETSIPFVLRNGSFVVTDLYTEGGTRLINLIGPVRLSPVFPNPANDIVNVQYGVIENGVSELVLVDYLGKEIQTIVKGIIPEGQYQTPVFVGSLPSGAYTFILRTPTQTFYQQFTIVR